MPDLMQERIERGELVEPGQKPAASKGDRKVVFTPADKIEMMVTEWLWNKRIPLGELSLLAGREGIGKSTLAYLLAAWVTTGTMRGSYIGKPRSVVIVATEDSWQRTIVPRLVGAGADLSRIFRCEVIIKGDVHGTLELPDDIRALEQQVKDNDVALILLDPLMSRLSSNLDSHKDGEVRQALEPLTEFAMRLNVAILGLIHVNKGSSADSLNLIMGSRAFPAVSRAVLFAMKDPEQEGKCLLGLEKSNLGPMRGVDTYAYEIVEKTVSESDTGVITTGVVNWLGDSPKSISEALELGAGGSEATSATREAADFIEDFLLSKGGSAPSAEVKKACLRAGISEGAINRGRKAAKIEMKSEGFPRTTTWLLPEAKRVGMTPVGPIGEAIVKELAEGDVLRTVPGTRQGGAF